MMKYLKTFKTYGVIFLTSPESSRPPIVPCEVSAPSANLETRPHSSALRGPTLAPAGPLLVTSSSDVGVELTVAGICTDSFYYSTFLVLKVLQVPHGKPEKSL